MVFFFFFKQKTAYEMRITDWSSDVCSSDLHARLPHGAAEGLRRRRLRVLHQLREPQGPPPAGDSQGGAAVPLEEPAPPGAHRRGGDAGRRRGGRSEEHTSELQSLMRNSYAVFCLKKKNKNKTRQDHILSYI